MEEFNVMNSSCLVTLLFCIARAFFLPPPFLLIFLFGGV